MPEPTPIAPPPGTVPVVNTTGAVGVLPEEAARAAFAAGKARAPTDAEWAKAQAVAAENRTQQQYGGKGSIAGTLAANTEAHAEGALRGLTFGMSDPAALGIAGALGGDQAREGLRQHLEGMKEANPYFAKEGELGGQAAGLILGGAKGGGVIADALGAPARGLNAVGHGAEALAAGIIPEGTPGALATGLKWAARGGVENTLMGAGQDIDEAALGDHDVTAEKLLAAAPGHFGIGALLGFGLGAGSELATSGKRAIAEALGRNKISGALEQPAKVADAAAQQYIDTKFAPNSQEAAKYGEIWRQRQKLFTNHEETLDDATRKASSAISDSLEAGRKVDMSSFGDAKTAQMADLVDTSKHREQRDALLDFWQRAKDNLALLRDDPTRGGAGPSVARAEKYLENFSKFAEASTRKSSIDMFSRADEFKRFLGREAHFGKGPFGLTPAAREFEAMYNGSSKFGPGLREVLEQPDVWGAAGDAQREINAATSNMLGTGRKFEGKFTTEYGSEMGRPKYVADPAAVSSFMGTLTEARNDLSHRVMLDRIDARRAYLDAVEKHYTFDAAGKAAVAKERDALSRLETTLRETTKDAALVNEVKKLHAQEQAQGIGGLLGLAADAASKPITTLRRIATVEHVAGTAADAAGLGPKATQILEMHRDVSMVDRRIADDVRGYLDARPAVRAANATAGLFGSGAKRQERFAKVADQVATYAANPERYQPAQAQKLGTMAQNAPNTSQSIALIQARVLSQLAQRLPQAPQGPPMLSAKPQKQTYSDTDISKFAHYLHASSDPLSILDSLKAGTLTPDEVDGVRDNYPKLYAQIQQTVLREVTSGKKPTTYAQRIQLGGLLGIPTDPTLDPGLIWSAQKAFATQGAPSQQQGGHEKSEPTSLADSTKTAADRAADKEE